MPTQQPIHRRRNHLLSDYVRRVYVPRRLTLKARSIEQIEVSERSLTKFLRRGAKLNDLTNELICRWLVWRLKTVSKATAKRNRLNVLAIWRDAMARGQCRRVVIDVPVIRVPRKLPRALPVADIERLLKAASDYRPLRRPKMPACGSWANWWVALLLTAYDSGARLNALLNVRVSDVDLVGRTITLRSEVAKTELEQVLPISSQTVAAIAKMIGGISGGEVRRPSPIAGSKTLLFDFPCARRAIWTKLKALARSAGVSMERGQAFHAIRKTHATLTTALGSVEQAASNLGHTSTAMTWSRYVDPKMLRALQAPAINLLPRLVFASAEMSGDPRRAYQLRLFG